MFFQSTPPRRRRRRTGGDLTLPTVFSIHASAKEATVKGVIQGVNKQNFQSTPPRRRRLIFCENCFE